MLFIQITFFKTHDFLKMGNQIIQSNPNIDVEQFINHVANQALEYNLIYQESNNT